MLARLLRFTILAQILFGLGCGYALHYFFDASVLWPWIMGASMPMMVLACSSIYSSILARTGWSSIALRAVWGEFIASLIIFLLRQPWTWKTPTLLPAAHSPAKTPVILVHGFLCNHRIWNDFIPAIQSQGHSVLPVNLEPVFTSIENYCSILENAVQQVTQHRPQQRVILVGHSMGGIAIRAWMRQHGSARVAGVITLGSPHQGTVLGRAAFSPNALQMAWRSTWLKALSASENATTRALFRIAITLQDNIVFPQKLQSLPGREAKVFEGIGHLQMCLSHAVRSWVLQQIQDIQQKETLI